VPRYKIEQDEDKKKKQQQKRGTLGLTEWAEEGGGAAGRGWWAEGWRGLATMVAFCGGRDWNR
jgi:hypothetical protein